MDYKKIKETKIQMNDLNSKMKLLENLQTETFEKTKKIQQTCKHDLIFINKKYKNKNCEYLQFGQCLVCGKTISLTPNNVNIETNKVIDEEYIVDVSQNVEEWCIDCDCLDVKREIEEAQKVFDSLIYDDNLYSRYYIKRKIAEALTNFNDVNKTK